MNGVHPTALGKYQVVQILGEGAMGVVYKAYDPILSRYVAAKTIRHELLGGAHAVQMLQRFRHEAAAAGRLCHPGIVAVYDFGEDDQLSYIVMEYVPGEDLGAHLRRHGLQPLPVIASIMAQLLDALHFAHERGVIHRDIKPGNLVLSEEGRLKVADFGIARIVESNLTLAGTALGTPTHMAPEQYRGLDVDGRADIFSAGVVFYELLTGHQPFVGASLEELAYKVCHDGPDPHTARNAALPASVNAVIDRALAKDRAARFSTAAEFERAVKLSLVSPPAIVASVSPLPEPCSMGGGASFRIAPALLESLEELLAPCVGPVLARAMTRRSALVATDSEKMAALLARDLKGVADEARLVTAIRSLLQVPVARAALSPPSDACGARALDPADLERVTKALAVQVGPIARVLVKKSAPFARDLRELCKLLAAQLGGEEERVRFFDDMGLNR